MLANEVDHVSFTGLVRQILEANPKGMTNQEILDTIKSDYSESYGTESHILSVEKEHSQDLDQAILVEIYAT